MKIRTASFWLALWFAAIGPCAAQYYHVRTYSEADGLPSSTVRDLAQDSLGRIWFATRSGVAVYDGSEWTRFPRHQGSNSGDTQRITVDDRGRVWTVAAHTLVVSLYENEQWGDLPLIESPPDCFASSIQVIPNEQATRLFAGTSCGLYQWSDGQWTAVASPDGWSEWKVTALALHEDRLFIATHSGLAVLTLADQRISPVPLASAPGKILGLALDPASSPGHPKLWVVGRGWLGRIDGDRYRSIAEFEPPVAQYSYSAVADGHEGIVFGSLTSLYRYDPANGVEELDESSGLIGPGAEGLLLDREGYLWVACGRGVSKVISFRLANYREEHGLYEDEVTAVLQRRDGELVLGHRHGVTLLGPAGFRRRSVEIEPKLRRGLGRILEMAQSGDGTIWLAGQAFGLGRLERDAMHWSWPLDRSQVSSVLVDRDDRLWISADDDVLVDRGRGFELLPHLPVEQGRSARRLAESADGTIYALTSVAGLFAWNGTEWSRAYSRRQPEMNNLFSLHEPVEGGLWIGSAAGLLELHGDELRAVVRPRIERPIYFIVRDARERYWFGTDNGVFRWDGDRLEHLTVEDGLSGRETNRAAGAIDAHGRLWVGTAHGVSVYRDEWDRPPARPPWVALTGLEASGESVDPQQSVKLAAIDNDLLFEFRAISFYDEDRVRVRTWLEGHEAEWSPLRTVPGRQARYTNLRPGSYRFHLQAVNQADQWSDVARSSSITIIAPYYRRAWFWFFVLACSLLVGFAVQAYVYQRRYSGRLQREVQQRLQELKRVEEELARAQKLESLGLLAGGIAHDFNNLLTVVLGNLSLLATEVHGDAAKWVRDADEAIERARGLTNQLLTFSRGDEPARVVSRIGPLVRESIEFVLNGSRVRAELDLPETLDLVEVDPTQMRQIFTNLVRNAVDAMPGGGTIRIHGRNVGEPPPQLEPGQYVAVEFRDSGEGVADEHLGQLFDPYFTTKPTGSGLGLATAHSIARHHGGLLAAASPAGSGAVFTLYLPSQAN